MTDRSALCYRLNLHKDPWCECSFCMQKLFKHISNLEAEIAHLKSSQPARRTLSKHQGE